MKPLKNYLRHSIDLEKNKTTRRDYTEEDLNLLVDLAFEKLFNDDGLFGDVKTCFKRAQEYAELGVTEIACLVDFGVDTEIVLENLIGIAKLKELTKQSCLENLITTKDINANSSVQKSSQIFDESLKLFNLE